MVLALKPQLAEVLKHWPLRLTIQTVAGSSSISVLAVLRLAASFAVYNYCL